MVTDEEQERVYAERPNKSAQKRELAARSALVEQATGLSNSELQRLGVSEDAVLEIAKVRAIKPSGARRRQLKYCVKRVSDTDLSAVGTYLNDRHSQQLELNQAFHHLERWRDRLIEEGDALLGGIADEWPHVDRQQLRQLVRDARREAQQGKPVGAKRKLFRYLRNLSET